ncbi:uncharacterized protein G2W53_003426 [Senna tora]|uniref:Uncharacterized protein n=1 Tax=Senna tora TaxID=362788 RepID=A0A834XB87_9FABA|nr:uncharacterized protein G2W53_003426 [Senna tora]
MARATQWRRTRKESMMLLLKVPVTSMEGDDDGTSYAMATSKEGVNDADTGTSYAVQAEQEVEASIGVIDDDTTKVTCVEEFSDVTTNGSRDEFERVDDVTHPSWCNACEDSKDEVECKKLTMVLTTVLPASMEGVGDTKDSREQSIPCAV